MVLAKYLSISATGWVFGLGVAGGFRGWRIGAAEGLPLGPAWGCGPLAGGGRTLQLATCRCSPFT